MQWIPEIIRDLFVTLKVGQINVLGEHNIHPGAFNYNKCTAVSSCFYWLSTSVMVRLHHSPDDRGTMYVMLINR